MCSKYADAENFLATSKNVFWFSISFNIVVVVAHIYPSVTGQHHTLPVAGIRTCLEVSSDPMFLWISSNSCPLNLLLFRSHQADIIIVKRFVQGRNNIISYTISMIQNLGVISLTQICMDAQLRRQFFLFFFMYLVSLTCRLLA